MPRLRSVIAAVITIGVVSLGLAGTSQAYNPAPSDIHVAFDSMNHAAFVYWSNPNSSSFANAQLFVRRDTYGPWLPASQPSPYSSASAFGLSDGLYSFAVATYDSSGNMSQLYEAADTVLVTGVSAIEPSAPGFPLAARDGANVTVTWEPSIAPEHDPLHAYELFMLQGDVWQYIGSTEPDVLSFTQPLTASGMYKFAVRAKGSVYSYESTSNWVVFGGQPMTPTNVQAKVVGQKLNISWKPSPGTGNYYEAETAYRVQMRHDGGEWSTVNAFIPATQISTSADLQDAGTYQARVVSISEFGESDPGVSDQIVWLGPEKGSGGGTSPITEVTNGVAVVDKDAAAGAAKVSSKLSGSAKRAHVTKTNVGAIVSITASGLAAKKRYRAQLLAKHRWLALGPFRTDGSGSGSLPAIACTKAGMNVLRVADPGGKVAGFLVLRCV